MYFDGDDDDQPVTDDTAATADPGSDDLGDDIGERVGEHTEDPSL